jgi:ribosome maturation factor RimP
MIKSDIQELLLPLIKNLGYQLWGCEYLMQGKHSLLRVYIDKEGGVGIADCEIVSRQVAALLDVEDPIPGNYSLEVSSPGIPRPLFYKEQYEQYIGHAVELKLRNPINKSRKLKGNIKTINDQGLSIEDDKGMYELPFSEIVKANLIGE